MINLSICKHLYNSLYNTAANLNEFIAYCPMTKRDAIDSDMRINGWIYLDFQKKHNSREMITAYDYFFILMVAFQQMKIQLRFPEVRFQIL